MFLWRNLRLVQKIFSKLCFATTIDDVVRALLCTSSSVRTRTRPRSLRRRMEISRSVLRARISDPYERPVEDVEYDERHGKHYPAALVDPLRDLLRRHCREVLQLGKGRSALEGLGRRRAVDGRDATDGTVLVFLYSHRWDVDGTRKTLKKCRRCTIEESRIVNRWKTKIGKTKETSIDRIEKSIWLIMDKQISFNYANHWLQRKIFRFN